jgi:hypothetical protein
MTVTKRGKAWAVGLFAGALIGGGIALVTPAGAAVQGAAAKIDWQQAWKTEIKPRADKRYYTKKKSNKRYYTKSQVTSLLSPYVDTTELVGALAGYYTKAQSDANYYTKTQSDTNYYTKTQSDAKYYPFPSLIRGTYAVVGAATAAGSQMADNVSFHTTLSAAPIGHYIKVGDPLPVGCSGSVDAPNAAAGNLCIFEALNNGSTLARGFYSASGSIGSTSNFGVGIYATAAAAGNMYVYGSWAVRPAALAPPAKPGDPGSGGKTQGDFGR